MKEDRYESPHMDGGGSKSEIQQTPGQGEFGGGPQEITKHGRTIAVVVAVEEWERKAERKDNLAEFLTSSPLRGSGLKIRRLPMRLRKVEL